MSERLNPAMEKVKTAFAAVYSAEKKRNLHRPTMDQKTMDDLSELAVSVLPKNDAKAEQILTELAECADDYAQTVRMLKKPAEDETCSYKHAAIIQHEFLAIRHLSGFGKPEDAKAPADLARRLEDDLQSVAMRYEIPPTEPWEELQQISSGERVVSFEEFVRIIIEGAKRFARDPERFMFACACFSAVCEDDRWMFSADDALYTEFAKAELELVRGAVATLTIIDPDLSYTESDNDGNFILPELEAAYEEDDVVDEAAEAIDRLYMMSLARLENKTVRLCLGKSCMLITDADSFVASMAMLYVLKLTLIATLAPDEDFLMYILRVLGRGAEVTDNNRTLQVKLLEMIEGSEKKFGTENKAEFTDVYAHALCRCVMSCYGDDVKEERTFTARYIRKLSEISNTYKENEDIAGYYYRAMSWVIVYPGLLTPPVEKKYVAEMERLEGIFPNIDVLCVI